MFRLTTFFTLVLITLNSFAGDRPEWLSKFKREDQNFKYYVGRSSNAGNEGQGFNQAVQDALAMTIRENFGFFTKVQSESYSSTTESTSTKRVLESSQQVRVQGFETTDTFSEILEDGKVNVWVLCRYSKAEIDREKSRLATLKDEEKAIVFSEQGEESGGVGSVLEIVTHPVNSSVFVDGESWGKTPIRLRGLSTGSHRILLQHPQYEGVEEQLVIVPNKLLRIDKTLLQAHGFLKIETSPTGAMIFVNGVPVGASPTADLMVAAGEPLRIEIISEEAERLSEDLRVGKNEHKKEVINLRLKPATLSVASDPPAPILIDEVMRGKSPEVFQLDPGYHVVTISKDGFNSYTEKIVLRGSEKRVLPLVKLKTLSDAERDKQIEGAARAQHLKYDPWVVGGGVGFEGSPIADLPLTCVTIGAAIEKRFFGLFGFGINLEYIGGLGGGAIPNTNGADFHEHSLNGFQISFGPRIYMGNFVVAGEIGFLASNYTHTTNNFGPVQNEINFSTTSFAGSAGYKIPVCDTIEVTPQLGYRKYGDDGSLVGVGALTVLFSGGWKF